MARFRKKPVVIEAVQWDGSDEVWESLWTWGGGRGNDVDGWDASDAKILRQDEGEPTLWIETLEGGHVASPGDWIIRGVKGEFYPCKPDIFAATYEPEGQP